MAREYGIGLWDDENILELIVDWLYNSVIMLKGIELQHFKWMHLSWYLNYISVQLYQCGYVSK